MIFVAVEDPGLAARLVPLGTEGVAYSFKIERAIEIVKRMQPEILLLGVRLGGNQDRSVEYIPQLLRLAHGMRVIVVTVRPTKAECDEMKSFGAFGFVDHSLPSLSKDLDRLIRLASVQGAPGDSGWRRALH